MGIDIVVVALVVVVVVAAAVRIFGIASGKRDCCSGDSLAADAPACAGFAAAHVEDTDPAHYPYAAELSVGGMSCEHCVAAVKNALESIEGNWAEVTLAGGRVVLHAKKPVDEAALREAVERAGYRVLSCAVSN